jgi:polyisoprenoid-binding protein YceI
MIRFLVFAATLVIAFGPAHAEELDLAASKIIVHVEKSGLFSAFAHNHTIAAPLASGSLDSAQHTVQLTFHSADMKVLDPEAKKSERATIESTMKSDKVLDVAHFPDISFVVTSVESAAPNKYTVHGNLTLHGATRPIEMPVSFSAGHYGGKVNLKQTDFGIIPVKIAGGAVRVKDVIQITFDVATK